MNTTYCILRYSGGHVDNITINIHIYISIFKPNDTDNGVTESNTCRYIDLHHCCCLLASKTVCCHDLKLLHLIENFSLFFTSKVLFCSTTCHVICITRFYLLDGAGFSQKVTNTEKIMHTWNIGFRLHTFWRF